MELNIRPKRLPLSDRDLSPGLQSLKPLKRAQPDRFIPHQVSRQNFQLAPNPQLRDPASDRLSRSRERLYSTAILQGLLSAKSGGLPPTKRRLSVLSFRKGENKENDLNMGEDVCVIPRSPAQQYQFNRKEVKILEAPSLADSFYFNVLDFAPNDSLAVALANHVYSFDHRSNATTELLTLSPGQLVSSLSFNKETGAILACGSAAGNLQLLDVERRGLVRTFKDPSEERIGALDWKESLLCHGAKSGRVYLKDTRAKDSQVARFFSHTQEVCTARFNPFNTHYLITGGNDDKVALYDLRTMREMSVFETHKAAVKGLAWSNSRSSTFVSGGGSGDRQICVWDVNRLGLVTRTTRGSQICNLAFTCDGLLLCTQGYPFNSVELLDPTTLESVASFAGHSQRVLFLAMNKAQSLAATGSPDETLRFWNVKNLLESTKPGDGMKNANSSFAFSLR